MTRFAQGDMFDPESNTAKEIVRHLIVIIVFPLSTIVDDWLVGYKHTLIQVLTSNYITGSQIFILKVKPTKSPPA